jgi:hypothetical protein
MYIKNPTLMHTIVFCLMMAPRSRNMYISLMLCFDGFNKEKLWTLVCVTEVCKV